MELPRRALKIIKETCATLVSERSLKIREQNNIHNYIPLLSRCNCTLFADFLELNFQILFYNFLLIFFLFRISFYRVS